jgi:hypothetical protein
MPLRLLSDQGTEFSSLLFQKLCNLMQNDKVRTSPYHQSCSGMLERYHRCLNSLLAKAVNANQRDWPDHLHTVVAAYRATKHETIGMSLNRAFLGRDLRLPCDLAMGTDPDPQDAKGMDLIDVLQNRMRE